MQFPHRWLDHRKEGTKRFIERITDALRIRNETTALLLRNSLSERWDEVLGLLEDEYGVENTIDMELRRTMIIAKMRMLDCPITLEDLQRMLESLKITAEFKISHNDYLLDVIILENGMNLPRTVLHNLLNNSVRAHIGLGMHTHETLTLDVFAGGMVDVASTYELEISGENRESGLDMYLAVLPETCRQYFLETKLHSVSVYGDMYLAVIPETGGQYFLETKFHSVSVPADIYCAILSETNGSYYFILGERGMIDNERF